MTTTSPHDGMLVLPRSLTIGTLCSVLLWAAGQLWVASAYVSKIDTRFEALDRRLGSIDERFVDERQKTLTQFVAVGESDRRILDRGDERWIQVRARLEMLERDRDRITRLEEQIKIATDLLREIRQAVGSRRDRP